MGFNKIFAFVAGAGIIGVFLIDILQKQTPLVVPVLVLILLIITTHAIFVRKITLVITAQVILLLTFFLYIILNGHLYCCSQESLKKVIRIGIGAMLYFAYSNIPWKQNISKTVLIYSLLLIPFGLVSITGFLYPTIWISFWDKLLTNQLMLLGIFETARGRIPPIIPLEITLIIPVALLFSKKTNLRLIGYLSFFLATLSIFVWNYRGYFLVSLLGITFLLWYLYKIFKTKIVVIACTAMVALSFTIYLFLSNIFTKLNILDRFSLIYKIDEETIISRTILFNKALDLFRSHPITGVGISNFELYSAPVSLSLTTPVGQRLPQFIMSYIPGPHNIFLEYLSETGLTGSLIFFGLLISFLFNDIQILRHKGSPLTQSINKTVIIIASWLFIAGALFNSYSRASFYTFFILRGLISSNKFVPS